MGNGHTGARWATIEDAGELIRLNHAFNGVYQTRERVKAKLQAGQ